LGAVLSQKFEDGKIHPCDILSRKLSPAEFNYDVFDKEMLAIIFALQRWRHFLQGSEFTTIIFSDHQNLLHLTKTVKLNRRQARWSEILQEYLFTILYRKGSQNLKADILSRCPAYTSGVGGTTAIVDKTMLGPDQWLEIRAMEIDDDGYETVEIGAMEIAKMDQAQKESLKQEALQDEEYKALCKATVKGENISKDYSIDQDLLCWKGRVYAPKPTRKRIMKSEHDSKIAGHVGRDRTMELISRNFYWPKMEEDVREYCSNCDICQRTKSPRHAKHGLLHPLELPLKPWTHLSMDFITDLPLSSGGTKILVVVDRFTKMAHYIPIDKKDTPTVARAYLNNVWKYHGFPEDVVSDRDGTFTGQYFTDIYDYLGIKRSMSTAFHPRTDGQTEQMNQVIEAYLRAYCNFEQNDWEQVLPMAEYAYKNSKHSARKITPFYANSGYERRSSWPTEIQFRNRGSELDGQYMTLMYDKLLKQLEEVRETMSKYYDEKRRSIEGFKKGDLVMLNGKNIRSKGHCKKLGDKMYRPLKVILVGHNGRYYRLQLPTSWKIHPTFNISLLEKYRGNDPEKEVVEIEADNAGWRMESIIARGPSNDDITKHMYLVKWEGYYHEENT